MASRNPALHLLPALLWLAPLSVAHGLEVGPLHVYQQPGPGLLAEVPVSGEEAELAGLSARVASAELYAQAGHTRAAFVTSLASLVERNGEHTGRILLKSARDLPPGQTVLLLELRWPGGELVRGYVVEGSPLPAAQAAATSPESSPMPRPTATSRMNADPSTATYLSQPGDSLGSIAQRSAAPGVSVARQMAAILALNPQHFERGDPHRLRAGALLRLPAGSDPALADAPASPTAPPPGAVPATPSDGPRPVIAAAPRLQIGPGRSENPGQEERLLVLEDSLASQSRQLEDRDGRLRALEAAVLQLTELVSLQRQQLAALGVSAPAATPSAPDPHPLAIAHSLIDADGSRPLPWYRQPWVQQSIIGFALLMFGTLAFTEARYHLSRYLRRRQRRRLPAR